MQFTLAAMLAWALFSTQAVAQLADPMRLEATPCWAGARDLGALYHVPPCGEIPSTLQRAHEICLSRWWFPGGMRCFKAMTGADYSPFTWQHVKDPMCNAFDAPPSFETYACRSIDERWKASGGPEAAKAATEKAEREDREFVERVAKEKP